MPNPAVAWLGRKQNRKDHGFNVLRLLNVLVNAGFFAGFGVGQSSNNDTMLGWTDLGRSAASPRNCLSMADLKL